MGIHPDQDIEERFRLLFSQHGDMVYNTALGMLQHKEDAEDITQEVFLKIFSGIDSFRNESQLKTWIYRITINTSLDQLRKKKKRRIEQVETDRYAEFNHPGVLAEQRENAAILFSAIGTLPEQQKAAFILQKLEGCTVAEIGQILSVSVQAAESLLARAKQNLRTQLSSYYEGKGR